MIELIQPPPLSLYIHIPWCLKKCPYCDFNSHLAPKNLPEADYVDALILDLEADLDKIWGRPIGSIFIGGGTPSLFSALEIERLLSALNARLNFSSNIEITLEANPGTFEQARFKAYRSLGINRLSVGIQSFQNDKLKALGRVHDASEAKKALEIVHAAGFDRFNIDLMHGLPGQTIDDALFDLNTAFEFSPKHLSWYELTIEPETAFAKHPPTRPDLDALWDIQSAGHEALQAFGLKQYEISAFALDDEPSRHNLNYWTFGDYLGIGAGAHSKLTNINHNQISRQVKTRNPRDYLNPDKAYTANSHVIAKSELCLEFMMNALRLNASTHFALILERTGFSRQELVTQLQPAIEKGFIHIENDSIKTTDLGRRFLNDCLACLGV
jgi:putative oxygen-independent coproporphyrinogen III oxidase